MSIEENKAIIRRFFDQVWNHGRVDILGEIIAPPVIRHRNDGSTVVARVEEEAEESAERFTGFAKIHVTCDDFIAERDRVAVRWIAHRQTEGEEKRFARCMSRSTGSRTAGSQSRGPVSEQETSDSSTCFELARRMWNLNQQDG
jgi:hypothetical protein